MKHGANDVIRESHAAWLIAALRQRGWPRLAEIVEAVDRDPRRGWLAVDSGDIQGVAGSEPDDDLWRHVSDWLEGRGVRFVDFPGCPGELVPAPTRPGGTSGRVVILPGPAAGSVRARRRPRPPGTRAGRRDRTT